MVSKFLLSYWRYDMPRLGNSNYNHKQAILQNQQAKLRLQLNLDPWALVR